MPYRNQATTRRHVNRLLKTVLRYKDQYPVLAVLLVLVEQLAAKVNKAWQEFQSVSVKGDKERDERESALGILTSWIQEWRPLIIMLVPGADQNIRNLPSQGTTPDDIIHVAEDMKVFLDSNEAAASFCDTAIDDLGDKLENARKETEEATAVLPLEKIARTAYSEACIEANPVIIRSSQIIRSIFGPTSPEYKQFITRNTNEEEDEIDQESIVGETETE